jgi:hypothetical protein
MSLSKKPKSYIPPKNRKEILSLIEDAVTMKLHMRIAIQLVMAGYSEKDVSDMFWNNKEFKDIPQPLLIDIQNSVRDIYRQYIPLTQKNKDISERV